MAPLLHRLITSRGLTLYSRPPFINNVVLVDVGDKGSMGWSGQSCVLRDGQKVVEFGISGTSEGGCLFLLLTWCG